MSERVYLTNEQTGEVKSFDYYAMRERGPLEGWRDATPAEATMCRRLEDMQLQIDKLGSALNDVEEFVRMPTP